MPQIPRGIQCVLPHLTPHGEVLKCPGTSRIKRLSFRVLGILHNNYLKLPRAAGTGGQLAVNSKALRRAVRFPSVGFPGGKLRPAGCPVLRLLEVEGKRRRGNTQQDGHRAHLWVTHRRHLREEDKCQHVNLTVMISSKAGYSHLTGERETSPRKKKKQTPKPFRKGDVFY